MGSQTPTWAIPYPVGTDRVMDGDNAMQALAERVDLLLGGTGGSGGGGAPAPAAPGLWQPATGMVMCNDTTLTPLPGSSVSYAQWMKIGRTVWYIGTGGSGTGTGTVAVTLPNAQAGAPKTRQYNCGTMIATGTGMSDQQSGVGFMGGANDRLIVTLKTNGYYAVPAGAGIRWAVWYETAT